jgi:integrase
LPSIRVTLSLRTLFKPFIYFFNVLPERQIYFDSIFLIIHRKDFKRLLYSFWKLESNSDAFMFIRVVRPKKNVIQWFYFAFIGKPVFKSKRAITAEEHASIILRVQNVERRDFYELLWQTGAAQSDGACLLAEDINWATNTICITRKKLKSRGTSIKPTLFRFSADIEAILRRRPTVGQLFPYLCTVRAGDRATEFRQRCVGLGISGVSLHCYRYAWAERALKCGFPERFAQQALGHNSKAVHRAYAKHADVTVPSLADWEKDWQENPQCTAQPKLLPVDFRSPIR